MDIVRHKTIKRNDKNTFKAEIALKIGMYVQFVHKLYDISKLMLFVRKT